MLFRGTNTRDAGTLLFLLGSLGGQAKTGWTVRWFSHLARLLWSAWQLPHYQFFMLTVLCFRLNCQCEARLLRSESQCDCIWCLPLRWSGFRLTSLYRTLVHLRSSCHHKTFIQNTTRLGKFFYYYYFGAHLGPHDSFHITNFSCKMCSVLD